VQKGDILLLCSDGFRHKVSEKEILSGLLNCENQRFNDVLRDLIDLNLKRKEQDNITVALIKVQ
jgi:protein serine/threonine phosphatase